MRPLACAALVAAIVLATPAFAQDSRDQELATRQAEKATQLHPYEPDAMERRLAQVDSLLKLMTGPVYPFVGSAIEGGGFSLGPGYRRTFADTGHLDVHAGVSLKNYKVADATLALPSFASDRISIEMRANWLDAPDVAFYGTGSNSLRDNRTGYAYRATTVGVTTRVEAARHLTVGAGFDAIQTETGIAGLSTDLAGGPLAGLGAAPALTANSPSYRRTRLFAEFDNRTSPGYTRRGGLYRVEWSDYRQTNAGPFSFSRVDAEARHFIPLMRENWIIALRAQASSTTTASGHEVPYFLLPELGGGDGLRGYPSWRFRDRNRLLLSGEYRWTAGQFVDMTLFLDAGNVASRMGDLDASGFKKTYGVGMTLHTATTTVTRIELARTSEGSSLRLSFSPSF